MTSWCIEIYENSCLNLLGGHRLTFVRQRPLGIHVVTRGGVGRIVCLLATNDAAVFQG